MVENNTVTAKLSDSQLNKLKRAVTDQTETILRMNVTMFNGNNLPHELFLTTRPTTKLKSATENIMSSDIKLSKAQISKIIQSGVFRSRLICPLVKTGLPLIKKVIKLLPKSVLNTLE